MRKFHALALGFLGLSVRGSPAGLIPSFGLFNIVNFKNDQCVGVEGNTASGLFGTCLSSSECSNQNGMTQGNCAAGFGVCCVFREKGCAGVRVTKNGTYITNPDFPSAEPAALANCDYTIQVPDPGKETCQIRLDFKDVVLAPQANGLVDNTASRITVTQDSGLLSPPAVSGTLSGQHMYVQIRAANPVINIDKIDQETTGKWEIQVSYIHCASPWKAPDGCTQYFKEDAGQVASFNNDCTDSATVALQGRKELTDQKNKICIRRNAGFSQVRFSADSVNRFSVGEVTAAQAGVGVGDTAANGECNDAKATVLIDGTHYCQARLASTKQATANAPITTGSFMLEHTSLAMAQANTRGFCLMYTQI